MKHCFGNDRWSCNESHCACCPLADNVCVCYMLLLSKIVCSEFRLVQITWLHASSIFFTGGSYFEEPTKTSNANEIKSHQFKFLQVGHFSNRSLRLPAHLPKC